MEDGSAWATTTRCLLVSLTWTIGHRMLGSSSGLPSANIMMCNTPCVQSSRYGHWPKTHPYKLFSPIKGPQTNKTFGMRITGLRLQGAISCPFHRLHAHSLCTQCYEQRCHTMKAISALQTLDDNPCGHGRAMNDNRSIPLND